MFNSKSLADGTSIIGGTLLSIIGYFNNWLQVNAFDFFVKYADAFMVGVMGGLGGYIIKLIINITVKKYKKWRALKK